MMCQAKLYRTHVEKPAANNGRLFNLAGATRFELATFGVTGRRSNQLNYAPGLLVRSNEFGVRRQNNKHSHKLNILSLILKLRT